MNLGKMQAPHPGFLPLRTQAAAARRQGRADIVRAVSDFVNQKRKRAALAPPSRLIQILWTVQARQARGSEGGTVTTTRK